MKLQKKTFARFVLVCNWITVGVGLSAMLFLFPFTEDIPHHSEILFGLSFLTLMLMGFTVVLAGVSGIAYKDVTTLDSRFSSGHTYRLRGPSAVRTGAGYLILGLFFIIGIVYALYGAMESKKEIEQDNRRMKEEFIQRLEEQRSRRELPEQPPHFTPR